MNQENIQKGKKVGADGLTKKERRALKIAAEHKDVNVDNKPIEKTKSRETEPPKLSHISDASKKTKSQTPKLIGENEKSTSKPPVVIPAVVKETNVEHKEKSVNPENENPGSLSKAQLKAQRRAIQEAQRNAKTNKTLAVVEKKTEKVVTIIEEKKSSPIKEVSKTKHSNKVALFNHLYLEDAELQSSTNFSITITGVHPAFLKLGEQYKTKSILGSNARCLALLSALKCLVMDFKTPPNQEFYRCLDGTIQVCMSYLSKCRPLAVSMTNAIKSIKMLFTQSELNESDDDKRECVLERIDRYIQDDIGKAGEAISLKVQEKISNGDVILTYGYSSLINRILVDAHKQEKRFKVIVLDARPLLEGKEMLRRLVCNDIPCSYLLINAASFVMSRVTKVLLGAHALLANGYVMSRIGTAQVALVANAYKKPVLVCCENYKFSERAQTDSFVCNEIGDPEALVNINTSERSPKLANWSANKKLIPLNILYDVTPSDLVTAVVTEIAVLPCTSVPVILRIRPAE